MGDSLETEAAKQRYAELIVAHALRVQPGQMVQIAAEPVHRPFVLQVVEAAYRRGAKYVNVAYSDPALDRLRITHSEPALLEFVPPFLAARYDYLLEQRGANLRIVGELDPDVLADLPAASVNALRLPQRKALKRFYEEGIGKSQVHWSVVAAATPCWGQKVFPASDPKTACDQLWQQILKICRADQPNCLERWQEHNAQLKQRARQMTEMQVETLYFRGPGTDLQVGLSRQARFGGGSELGPYGVEFEPNIPTEEVFTTPDYRRTQGQVSTTRPFVINGKLIVGLKLRFEAGEIVDYSAEQGAETFAEYIGSDQGAKRLGEVALVGIDSPVYQSGLVFQEILYDENAACHIAIGSAYKFCVQGADAMSDSELDALGVNESHVHTDMMISSEQVDVSAKTYRGAQVELIKAGRWVLQP